MMRNDFNEAVQIPYREIGAAVREYHRNCPEADYDDCVKKSKIISFEAKSKLVRVEKTVSNVGAMKASISGEMRNPSPAIYLWVRKVTRKAYGSNPECAKCERET